MSAHQQKLMGILLSPRLSEKTTRLSDRFGQVVFKVATAANKTEVKEAVEFLFNVKVKAVTMLNVKGKTKRGRLRPGSTKSWKKAYVSLHEGYDIDFMDAE